MNNEPVAYINVEERKLEWAKPTIWRTPTIAQMDKIPLYIMPNAEPVAIRYDFDGYGYQYIDSGSGSDWQTRVDGEPLYIHPADESFDRTASHMAGEYVSYPAKTLTEIIEKNKPEIEKANAYIKSLEDEIKALKAKTLTDEEIISIADAGEWHKDEFAINFARAILRKAQDE
jgi:hypothetical protein